MFSSYHFISPHNQCSVWDAQNGGLSLLGETWKTDLGGGAEGAFIGASIGAIRTVLTALESSRSADSNITFRFHFRLLPTSLPSLPSKINMMLNWNSETEPKIKAPNLIVSRILVGTKQPTSETKRSQATVLFPFENCLLMQKPVPSEPTWSRECWITWYHVTYATRHRHHIHTSSTCHKLAKQLYQCTIARWFFTENVSHEIWKRKWRVTWDTEDAVQVEDQHDSKNEAFHMVLWVWEQLLPSSDQLRHLKYSTQ